MERRILKLNWREIKELKKNINKVILPVGTIEAHGITSMGTDVEIPEKISEVLADKIDALILPSVNYGITSSLLPYPGSINIDNDVFSDYILNIAKSLKKDSFKYFIIMNGHGGNNDSLNKLKKKIYLETGMFVILIHWWEFAYPICKEVFGGEGGHAGVDETAMMYFIDKNTVKKNMLDKTDYYKIKNGIESIPSPEPIIVYNENFSQITFDEKKIENYFNKVCSAIFESVKEIIEAIEKNFN